MAQKLQRSEAHLEVVITIGHIGSSNYTSQLYAKLFQHTDANQDGTVSSNELDSARQHFPQVGSNASSSAAVFTALDRDTNGSLDTSEMATSTLFDESMMHSIIDLKAQDDGSKAARATLEKAFLDDHFVRTDLDQDGVVSAAEHAAYSVLQRASFVDGGSVMPTGPMLMIQGANADGSYSRAHAKVTYLISDHNLYDHLPPRSTASPPAPTAVDASKKPDRDWRETQSLLEDAGFVFSTSQLSVEEQIEADSQAPLTSALITRLLARLEEAAGAVSTTSGSA